MNFPRTVATAGRKYVVDDAEEYDQLMGWLVEGRLALANRYRVGVSWPRGKRAHRCRPMFSRGESVLFHPQAAGYGYNDTEIPAAFIEMRGTRALIAIYTRDGQVLERRVSPKNLTKCVVKAQEERMNDVSPAPAREKRHRGVVDVACALNLELHYGCETVHEKLAALEIARVLVNLEAASEKATTVSAVDPQDG